MDIAALSMSLHQSQLMQTVSLAVTKQAMEFQQQTTEQLTKSWTPHIQLQGIPSISRFKADRVTVMTKPIFTILV